MSKTSRESLLVAIEEEAKALEHEYHGCSRCVLIPLQKHLGLPDGATVRAVSPLAGGIALSGETCGALTGGLVAVGLAVADEDVANRQAFLDTMTAAFRFHRRFQKQFGDITCRALQTTRLGAYYSMAKPEEYQRFIEAGGYEVCSSLVGSASRLAAEYILELHDKDATKIVLSV